MKITVDWVINLTPVKATKKVNDATKASLVATVAAIAGDAIKLSPFLTGNNRRSIKYEVGPGGLIATKELQGAIYSTSGYGGYLETGTVKMSARPYFKPAYDMNIKKLITGIAARLK